MSSSSPATGAGRAAVTDRLRMPASVLAALACPHCGAGISPAGNALACAHGHGFDVAREGYVSLLTGQRPTGTGDTKEMVRARQEFQEAGHYAPLAARLAALAAEHLPAVPAAGSGAETGLVADIGAGTGYYLREVLEGCTRSTGLALDVSKFALRRAAKAHPRAGAAACDAWRGLPLGTGTVALLLNVFAPRDGAEFRRVLREDGALIVVTPTARHLHELIDALGLVTVDARKEERLETTLGDHFSLTRREELDHPMRLPHAAVATAVGMGPSARHLDPGELERRISRLPTPAPVTASFLLSVYRPV
ncbi:methyltransferase type 11 [Nocardiopsis gilva YIM 90087]|uniref:Methyltransferase type 11 n=2 Tax=Nocardiopsis gilva TaxID=280236 RepID=A0A223SDK7_9ACTN|nr:methyltransferase type 11 [Nocardiopsis gilva]ASU86217.1 methyltransferase type 11 [Nocardiopsis gilva YIM 90087]